ncbi:L-rhamnose isomerase [Escherichia coli]
MAPMSFTWGTPLTPDLPRLDAGIFHRLRRDSRSAAMLYVPQLLLHVSRPVRWDSDHVVLLDDRCRGNCQ